MKSVLQKNRFFNNDFVVCGDNHLFFSFFVCVLGFIGCCFLRDCVYLADKEHYSVLTGNGKMFGIMFGVMFGVFSNGQRWF